MAEMDGGFFGSQGREELLNEEFEAGKKVERKEEEKGENVAGKRQTGWRSV